MNALYTAIWLILSFVFSYAVTGVAVSGAVQQTSQSFSFEQVHEFTEFTWSTTADEDANYTQVFFIIKNLYNESGNGPFEQEYGLSEDETSAKQIAGADRLRTILFTRRGRISQYQIKLCRPANLNDCVRTTFLPILVAPRTLRLTFNDIPPESWNDYFIPAANSEVREPPVFTFFFQGEAGTPTHYKVVLEGGLNRIYVVPAATRSPQQAFEQPEIYDAPAGQVFFNSHYRFAANEALPAADTGVVITWSVRPCVDQAFNRDASCTQNGCSVDSASEVLQREVCAVLSTPEYQTRTFTALPPLGIVPPPDTMPPANGPTFAETVGPVFGHERCITCHRMTQEEDAFGVSHRTVRIPPAGQTAPVEVLSDSDTCVGCHLPAFLEDLEPADHGLEWFAPEPDTSVALWAVVDDSVERCELVKAGMSEALDEAEPGDALFGLDLLDALEKHLLHDGRVVWGVHPPPTNFATDGFGGKLPNANFVDDFPVASYDEWVGLVNEWVGGGANCGLSAPQPIPPDPTPQIILNRFPPSTRITREGGEYPHNQALQVGLICQPHPASSGAMCDNTYYAFNAGETLAEFRANGNQLNQIHNIQTQPGGATLPITITNGSNRSPGDTVILDYYSVDQEGNQEEVKRDIFTITQGDVTPPVSQHEVVYTFNSFLNFGRFRLVLSCEDNSGDCTVRYQRTGTPAEGTYTSRTNIILRDDQVAEYRFFATDPSNNRESDQMVTFDPARFAESDPPVVTTNISPGDYSEPLELTLSCVDQNTQEPTQAHECVIYYTTDGAEPVVDAPLLYNAPIALGEDGTHAVKVLAVDTSPRRNAAETLTFIYNIDLSSVSGSAFQD